MKKIIKQSIEMLLLYKSTYDKTFVGNISNGLKLIDRKYGLFRDHNNEIRFKTKCSICERENSYQILGCNIPKSIEIIGRGNIEPNFICYTHKSGNSTNNYWLEHNLKNYIEKSILPYGYYVLKINPEKCFPEKLWNIEDFKDRNSIENDSILKIIYTEYDILAVISEYEIIEFPEFEFVTSTKITEWKSQSYSIRFNDYIPDQDIFDYNDKGEFSNGDNEYDSNREYGSEEQIDFNINWEHDFSNITDYLNPAVINEIKILRRSKLKMGDKA